MKILILTFSLAFSICFAFSQECKKSELSEYLVQKKISDSIYKIDVKQRIEFYAVLSNDILPKYSDLKKSTISKIDYADLEQISQLKSIYDENRLNYLAEAKENQKEIYNGVAAYSKLNTIILFETLDIFPDSYAIIFNPLNKLKEKDKILFNKIYQKYSMLLFESVDCYMEMKLEINKTKKKFRVLDINQNKGNKTIYGAKKADLIDLLIWSL
ncbi:hypothetical protein ACKGJY_02605 [Hyunsoonleella sp. 2307UL5-6]|uniref:hypothetical protein n=1 Tax=Hyunsoonleella sp. 2307UL5-6 TaxID=3384768 RepID=UPI0039BC831D